MADNYKFVTVIQVRCYSVFKYFQSFLYICGCFSILVSFILFLAINPPLSLDPVQVLLLLCLQIFFV